MLATSPLPLARCICKRRRDFPSEAKPAVLFLPTVRCRPQTCSALSRILNGCIAIALLTACDVLFLKGVAVYENQNLGVFTY